MTFRIGEKAYVLRRGDVFHFKASVPHTWRNQRKVIARFVILGTLSPALCKALHRHLSERGRKTASAGH